MLGWNVVFCRVWELPGSEDTRQDFEKALLRSQWRSVLFLHSPSWMGSVQSRLKCSLSMTTTLSPVGYMQLPPNLITEKKASKVVWTLHMKEPYLQD